jgi:hypothetical protein
MFAAGFFEYNFGDSEFLMMFLVLATLPVCGSPRCEPARDAGLTESRHWPVLLPPLPPDRARALIARFPATRILVVGDVMLDRFIAGRVTRISPEAPVPVVAFEHDTHRLGGAANVAHNIAAFGAQATLVGVTGQDDASTTLRDACLAAESMRRCWSTSTVAPRRRFASSPNAISRWRAWTMNRIAISPTRSSSM